MLDAYQEMQMQNANWRCGAGQNWGSKHNADLRAEVDIHIWDPAYAKIVRDRPPVIIKKLKPKPFTLKKTTEFICDRCDSYVRESLTLHFKFNQHEAVGLCPQCVYDIIEKEGLNERRSNNL